MPTTKIAPRPLVSLSLPRPVAPLAPERHDGCSGRGRRAMRDSLVELLFLPVALSLGACGGSVRAAPGQDASDEGSSADAGTCPAGTYPVECAGGPLFYCCPAGAHCEPPSCGSPDASDAAAPGDSGPCPPDQYLLTPCCGGYNDTSCSNGPGPPPPFCTALPASCAGQSTCTLGGCEGPVDPIHRTFGCICI